jgi:hypothetical protein
MAHLWLHHEQDQQWRPVSLNRDPVGLTEDPQRPLGSMGSAVAIIVPGPLGGAARALIAPPRAAVWVNGDPLLLGIRVLADRDSIRVGSGQCFFYSTETLPRVVAFPDHRVVPCNRCKTDITPGALVVKCPGCGAWHHQAGDMPCWTYAQKCSACDQPTAMDGEYRWGPEGL